MTIRPAEARDVANGGPPTTPELWAHRRSPFGWGDVLAIAAWSAALAAFFWDVVTLRAALFYFDITEINLPYRDFFARELQAGRFSRWHPGLYCGMPLYSESQVGYLHPLKYVLYPWMEPWKAFGLDTVLSIWLIGLATYGWLRRHVGAIGALAGASLFGLSGFVWAHFVHTSMINAMVSVPLAAWALECAWEGGRLRGVALGGAAMACQVFAGHLQDFLLTGLAVGFYGVYRAAIERGWKARGFALGTAAGVVVLGVMLSAVQWIPSKELLDRSPRAGGLTWEELTFGSWHPELLPTLVVREAYGTRARDTDWMDGFYPYHEMNTYMGLIGLGLAIVGAAAYRDRWVGFWVILAIVGGLLMLGRFTMLMDHAHRVPVLGSSRIPVRFHLWTSLAVAALAGVGADRLARPGPVRLRRAIGTIALLVVASVPILLVVYEPAIAEPDRWPRPYHQDRYRWLARELVIASARTVGLGLFGLFAAGMAVRSVGRGRGAWASVLPAVIVAELLGAHWWDVPTIDPAYWTVPPQSARAILAESGHQRVSGLGRFSAGEPGYASQEVDFLAARDTLAWSLAPVYGLRSVRGETPMIPRRWSRYMEAATGSDAQHAVAGVSHVLAGYPGRIADWPEPDRSGTAYIFTNARVLPRVRVMGRPVYADGEDEAAGAVARLGQEIRERVVVEDPERPIPEGSAPEGSARIVSESPERLVVAVETDGPAYLVVSDSYDPGWSATIDGRPAPIRPAFVQFRAVLVPPGVHEVDFRYRPAGFVTGLVVSAIGSAIALAMVLLRRPIMRLGPTHGPSGWPSGWPWWGLAAAVLLVAASAVRFGQDGVRLHSRFGGSLHPFTWGAGLEAMQRGPMIRGP